MRFYYDANNKVVGITDSNTAAQFGEVTNFIELDDADAKAKFLQGYTLTLTDGALVAGAKPAKIDAQEAALSAFNAVKARMVGASTIAEQREAAADLVILQNNIALKS